MSSSTLTCHCRFCGNSICYSRDHSGQDIHCPRCSQVIRLPGKLANIATIERRRSNNPQGIALEVAGFVCMFLFFPWGLIAGVVLLAMGWTKTNRLICSNCGGPVSDKNALSCKACRTPFGRE